MSVHISARIWDTKFPDPSRKLVALAIADAANKEGGAWPSLKTLADMCDLSEDSIRRHIRGLEEMGLLERENRYTNGRQTSNVYQFRECAHADPPLHPCNPPPCMDATLPLAPMQGSCIEPSEEPSEELDGVKIPTNLNTPEFKEAWDEWKKYRKQARFKALTEIGTKRKFKELSEWGPDRAIAAIHRSIGSSWQGIFEGFQGGAQAPVSEKMAPLDDRQKWLAELFLRPESQTWSPEERNFYNQIPEITPEEMRKVEIHIRWTRRYKPDEFLHRSLRTMLERWSEVLDAARRFKVPLPF